MAFSDAWIMVPESDRIDTEARVFL